MRVRCCSPPARVLRELGWGDGKLAAPNRSMCSPPCLPALPTCPPPGVLLIAKSPDAAAWLSAAFKDGSSSSGGGSRGGSSGSIEKTYWAVVVREGGGDPGSSSRRRAGPGRSSWLPVAGTVSLPVPSSKDAEQLQPAHTAFRVLRQSDTLAWLELQPTVSPPPRPCTMTVRELIARASAFCCAAAPSANPCSAAHRRADGAQAPAAPPLRRSGQPHPWRWSVRRPAVSSPRCSPGRPAAAERRQQRRPAAPAALQAPGGAAARGQQGQRGHRGAAAGGLEGAAGAPGLGAATPLAAWTVIGGSMHHSSASRPWRHLPSCLHGAAHPNFPHCCCFVVKF